MDLKHQMQNPGWILQLLIAAYIIAAAPASSTKAADPNSEASPPSPDQTFSSELGDGWRLMRTRNPKGGADAISITHPADTSRSDLDLVGLMIRCSEKNPEVLVVVLSALPASTRPHVTLETQVDTTEFEATVAPPGTLVLLPEGATRLVLEQWQSVPDLAVRVDHGKSAMAGVVKLGGLSEAFKTLESTCPVL
jgi:hypothetical protein